MYRSARRHWKSEEDFIRYVVAMNRWGIIEAQQYIANLQHRSSTGLSLVHFHITNNLSGIFVNSDHCLFHRKGHVVEMDRTTYHLYKQLIGWEQKEEIASEKTDRCYWETV